MTLNELQPIFVPAEVKLRLKLESPYDEKWAPYTCPDPIQLKPGATHRIGDVRFAAALPAVVHVVDKDDNSVEGVPVRRMHNDERAWCVTHNTDQDGRAFFFVNPHSQRKFRVSDIRGPKEKSMAKGLFADFKVGQEAPADVFQIKITDKQIRLLPGSRPD